MYITLDYYKLQENLKLTLVKEALGLIDRYEIEKNMSANRE